jgi:hypothetical protein
VFYDITVPANLFVAQILARYLYFFEVQDRIFGNLEVNNDVG